MTIAEEGALGLSRGWLPTLLGYSTQGLFKFGLYEFFKVRYAELVGDKIAFDYRTWLYLMSSASAEFFADIGLAPMEAVKVLLNSFRTVDQSKTFTLSLHPGVSGANSDLSRVHDLYEQSHRYHAA